MQNVRTYNTIGTSVLNGETKPRFANNGANGRFMQLVKNGHEDISLKNVAKMDKNNALRTLLQDEDFAEAEAEIEDYAERNSRQIRDELKGKQTTTALVVAGPCYTGVPQAAIEA